MKVEFKGIVRGSYSYYQYFAEKYNEPLASVMKFVGNDLESVLKGLAIEEWIFILKVNGKRIKDPFEYIKRKGLQLSDYMREEVAA